MRKPYKYTKEVLEPVVSESFSYAEVVRKLGLRQTGGSQANIKIRVELHGIDTSHFTGQGWLKGKVNNNSRKYAKDILILRESGNPRAHVANVRRSMLESGMEYICSECNINSEWNGKYLTLQVDHKNGNGLDNRIENLRFLCPNCHSQTDNFGAKNIAR